MASPRNLLMILCALSIGMLSLSACGDDPAPTPREEVAGLYDFTQLTFRPTASAIQPANVLDTLVARETSLELLGSGQFLLRYQLVGGQINVVTGNFDVSETAVVLSAASNTAALLSPVLLHTPLRLERDATNANVLRASILRDNVNLAAFSRRYQDVPPVRGTLEISLQRRQNQ